MNIDYSKLTIKHQYAKREWLQYERPLPKGFDSFEDIPEDDRSTLQSDHVATGPHLLGLKDSNDILAACQDRRWSEARRYILDALPFIAACRAVIALSPDEELTKEYAYWAKITEEGIIRELKREHAVFDEVTRDKEKVRQIVEDYRKRTRDPNARYV